MTLSKEQLQELTDAIIERLTEFEISSPMRLTKGVVRVAHDVIKKWYEEKEEGWAMQRISEVTITSEMAMKLSKQGYEMGYAAAKSELERVPAPATDDNIHRAQGALGEEVVLAKRQADFNAIIDELQRLAMGGVMPSMSTWEASRKVSLPRAQAIIYRYQKGWKELADIAGLQWERRQMPKVEPVHINGTWDR